MLAQILYRSVAPDACSFDKSTVPFMSVYRFTQNLSVFRRDINDSLKGPVTSSGGGGGSEMMTS